MHLSSDAICAWAAGERSAETERHLGECAECATEVRRLEAGITGFRQSACQWAEQAPPVAAAKTPWRALFAATAVAAGMAAAVCIALPVERARQAERDRADAALLQQVDDAISRSAPEPMEPLWKLVSTSGENQ